MLHWQLEVEWMLQGLQFRRVEAVGTVKGDSGKLYVAVSRWQ
jgi:hypothetical protein